VGFAAVRLTFKTAFVCFFPNIGKKLLSPYFGVFEDGGEI
jgi:hypothetical protein